MYYLLFVVYYLLLGSFCVYNYFDVLVDIERSMKNMTFKDKNGEKIDMGDSREKGLIILSIMTTLYWPRFLKSIYDKNKF